MLRIGMIVLASGIAVSSTAARAGGPPCAGKSFQTQMIRTACDKGGQDEAKKVMVEFVKLKAPKPTKGAPPFNCKTCHTALAPTFERTADAVEFYKALGGK